MIMQSNRISFYKMITWTSKQTDCEHCSCTSHQSILTIFLYVALDDERKLIKVAMHMYRQLHHDTNLTLNFMCIIICLYGS